MEENDNESKLIEAVRDRKVLYDKTWTGYSSRTLMQRAWNEVAKQINVPVFECNKMWKNLRQQYFAHQRKLKSPSGSSASRRTFFRHEESMRFVTDSAPEDSSYTNVGSDEGNEFKRGTGDTIEISDNISDGERGDAGATGSGAEATSVQNEQATKTSSNEDYRPHRKFNGKRKLDPFDQELVTILKASSTDVDEFKLFGDFIAQKLREMNKLDPDACSKMQLDFHYVIHTTMQSLK